MKTILIGLLFLPLFAEAKDYGSAIVSEVVSVYDADTFRVNIEGWPPIIGENIKIRLANVDAPERRGKCQIEKVLAEKGRVATQERLAAAQQITLKNIKRGKYFRIIADVIVDDVCLAELLLSEELARPYNGGKRKSWCNQGE